MNWRLDNLPRATSFAEGQRLVYGCLVAGAGMFCGAAAIGMIALLMWGGWDKAQEGKIVTIFGWTLGGFILCMSIVIVGLLVGGPVGRFKGGLSRTGGLSLEASGEEASVTTTTTTEVNKER
jgi:hypothetical protein